MIYGVFIGILSFILVCIAFIMKLNSGKKSSPKPLVSNILLIAGVLALILVPGSFHQVNTGEVAVVRHLGEIKESRQAGVYFDLWLTNKYERYDAKVQQVSITTPAYSKDGQTLNLQVVIQYQIQPENVKNIASIYGGLSMLESRIEAVSIDKIKAVFSEKTAMETIETRNKVSSDVTERVNGAISSDYYVNINSVVLTDIEFTKEFEKIVEEKVAAEQEAQKAVNEAAKKETEAEAAKKVAQLEADAALYKAQKESEAILLAAKAKADADVLQAQATAQALSLKSIEVAKMLGYNVTEKVSGEDIVYTINFDETHDGSDIKQYIQYMEYLATWNGILPDTLVGDEAIQILIPAK